MSGPRAHILGVIAALRGQGHDVEEFILGDRLRPSISGNGSRRLVTGGWLRQVAVDVVRLWLRVSVARQVRRELRGPFDVVYERYALFQQLGRQFQRRGVPWVIETNAVMAQEARHERNALALRRVAAFLERRSYRQADLVVCISEPLRDLLVDDLALPRDKVVVLPNAVDIARFPGARTPAGEVAPDGELVVGFVGFVIERQGLDELIGAVAELRRRGTAIRAVIVGDGPDRQRLEELALDEGEADAVEFTGQVRWDDVPSWIESFSVGYSGQRGVAGMPMYHSPLKIYEYLASGRPVIATGHGDAEEALIAPRAGWTFPPGDQEALTKVLADVAAMPRDDVSAYGRRAREHVVANHTWDARATQLVAEMKARGLTP